MTKILAPLSSIVVAHQEIHTLTGYVRETFYTDGLMHENISREYCVASFARHVVFLEVPAHASRNVQLAYVAHEKDVQLAVCVSVLLHEGSNISLDISSFIAHEVSRSDVRIHVVFNAGARATVRAFTRVDASRSVANEEIRGLVLGSTAYASFIPELSLMHHDIVASHATSVTNVDEQHIAYLRSRGVTRENAVREIADAFLHAPYGNLS